MSTEAEARDIEYITAEGEVIFTMGPWSDGREGTPEDAQMFYDDGGVGDANGAWLITHWRYKGDNQNLHVVKKNCDITPTDIAVVRRKVMDLFRAEVAFLDYPDAVEVASQLSGDLARFSLSSRTVGSRHVLMGQTMTERRDFDPPIEISPEDVTKMFEGITIHHRKFEYAPMDGSEFSITESVFITADQIRALHHALTDPECHPAGFSSVIDRVDASVGVGSGLRENHGPFLIDASIPEDGALLVNYKWNTDGSGTWLESDGGWQYPPGNSPRSYPWRTV